MTTAWSDVQTQYQRRADFVQQAVAIVRGQADFESETLQNVIEARSRATSITISANDLDDPAKVAAVPGGAGRARPVLRPPPRDGRGLPDAPDQPGLPEPPEPGRGDREPHRDGPPRLQPGRRRPQRAHPDVPDQHRRGRRRHHAARAVRRRRRRRARAADQLRQLGRVRALRPSVARPRARRRGCLCGSRARRGAVGDGRARRCRRGRARRASSTTSRACSQPGERDALERKLVALDDSTGTQVAVVIVGTTDGIAPNEYATELGRAWGVGQRGTNNGVVLLAAMDDRQVYIATGYGAEGGLTDATSRDHRAQRSSCRASARAASTTASTGRRTPSRPRSPASSRPRPSTRRPGRHRDARLLPAHPVRVPHRAVVAQQGRHDRRPGPAARRRGAASSSSRPAAWRRLRRRGRLRRRRLAAAAGAASAGFGGGSFGGGGAGGSW